MPSEAARAFRRHCKPPAAFPHRLLPVLGNHRFSLTIAESEPTL
ncbi:hypothetical protein [Neisseria lactamica]|nr:hypothetical protein [Neisseria lactamica]